MTAKPKREARGAADATPFPKKTKSLVLDASTASKLEALAETLHQTESSIANQILEKGTVQMILERAPRLAQDWPPLRYRMGRIEGPLFIRRPGIPRESESTRTYSFEIIQEVTDFDDHPATLLTLAYIFDAEQRAWRRLNDREASEIVRDVHGPNQLFIDTQAGVRWLLIEACDLVNRDYAPPVRDVLVRLRRVPSGRCPDCGRELARAAGAVSAAAPDAVYCCTNPDCKRCFGIDRAGNLFLAPGSPTGRPKAALMTFAQLRGILSSATPVTSEDLERARRGRNINL